MSCSCAFQPEWMKLDILTQHILTLSQRMEKMWITFRLGLRIKSTYDSAVHAGATGADLLKHFEDYSRGNIPLQPQSLLKLTVYGSARQGIACFHVFFCDSEPWCAEKTCMQNACDMHSERVDPCTGHRISRKWTCPNPEIRFGPWLLLALNLAIWISDAPQTHIDRCITLFMTDTTCHAIWLILDIVVGLMERPALWPFEADML